MEEVQFEKVIHPRKKIFKCNVKCCDSKSSNDNKLSYHCFPKRNRFFMKKLSTGEIVKVDRWESWRLQSKIDNINSSTRICGLHFTRDDFSLPDLESKQCTLNARALPGRNLPPSDGILHANQISPIANIGVNGDTRKNDYQSPGSEGSTTKLQVETLIVENYNVKKNLWKLLEEEESPLEFGTIVGNSFCGKENCSDRQPGASPEDDIREEGLVAGDLRILKSVSDPMSTFQDESTQTLPEWIKTSTQDNSIQTSPTSCSDKSVQVQSGDLMKPFTMCITTDRRLHVMCGVRNHAILSKLVSLVAELYSEVRSRKIVLKDRLILTLMKLKLNLTFSALAIMFDCVDKSTCRYIFPKLLPKLAQILRCAIRWVSKEEIQRNIPKCFKKFRNTVVVVDCTEFKVQKPKCLQCRIKLYSQYKANLTAKFMTAVSPGGMLTFLSKGYRGRASDKAIFEQSAIINLLEKGDALMTDKEFYIEDICIKHGVKLFIPPYLRQQKQLSSAEAI